MEGTVPQINICSASAPIQEVETEQPAQYTALNPYTADYKNKQLRSCPRPTSNMTEEQSKNFHMWIKTPSHRQLPSAQVQPFKVQDAQKAGQHESQNFRRVMFNTIPESAKPEYEQKEVRTACSSLLDMMELRDKYMYYDDSSLLKHPLVNAEGADSLVDDIPTENLAFIMQDGIIMILHEGEPLDLEVISRHEFFSDLHFVQSMAYNVVVKSFAYLRLKLLHMKFDMHQSFNGDREAYHQTMVATRDFYNITKVDNHVQLSGCMTQKHLQRFIKKKMQREPDTVIFVGNGEKYTLSDLFIRLNITPEHLTTDLVSCMADKHTFKRLNIAASKCAPMSQPMLRKLFLERGGVLCGRYFAELVRQVTKNLEVEQYSKSEYSLTVYGKDLKEWSRVARWFVTYKLRSPTVRWNIQIPSCYEQLRTNNKVTSFQELIQNVFEPLFRVTNNPSSDPNLHKLLTEVSGFDFFHEEGKFKKSKAYLNLKAVSPADWTSNDNPPFSYWSYYIATNLKVLNRLRYSKSLNTFAYRPHCGQGPSEDNLSAAFLLAHSINHGLHLAASPSLQYLFYLRQIGVSMSPLSNNKHAVKFKHNPFHKFLKRGLNVALSTDDPLLVHMTKEPLLEEYSISAQILELSQNDLCEVARNSVLQSGFTLEQKMDWLGRNFMLGTPDSNDISKTNLSDIRITYRYECFMEEHNYIRKHSN